MLSIGDGTLCTHTQEKGNIKICTDKASGGSIFLEAPPATPSPTPPSTPAPKACTSLEASHRATKAAPTAAMPSEIRSHTGSCFVRGRSAGGHAPFCP